MVDYQNDFVTGSLGKAKIIIDSGCTASADETMNQKALDVMRGLQIEII